MGLLNGETVIKEYESERISFFMSRTKLKGGGHYGSVSRVKKNGSKAFLVMATFNKEAQAFQLFCTLRILDKLKLLANVWNGGY